MRKCKLEQLKCPCSGPATTLCANKWTITQLWTRKRFYSLKIDLNCFESGKATKYAITNSKCMYSCCRMWCPEISIYAAANPEKATGNFDWMAWWWCGLLRASSRAEAQNGALRFSACSRSTWNCNDWEDCLQGRKKREKDEDMTNTLAKDIDDCLWPTTLIVKE